MVQKIAWRIQGIKAGASKEKILDYFEKVEQRRMVVKTVCPSVDDPNNDLTATIEYTPDQDALDHTPRLRDNIREELGIDRDFFGFTPLYSPAVGTHDAEYVIIQDLENGAVHLNISTTVSLLSPVSQPTLSDLGHYPTAICGYAISFHLRLVLLAFSLTDTRRDYKDGTLQHPLFKITQQHF
jgi:hypothetical protein